MDHRPARVLCSTAAYSTRGNLPVGTDGATGQQLATCSRYNRVKYSQSMFVMIGQDPPPMNGLTKQIFADCPSPKNVTVGKEKKNLPSDTYSQIRDRSAEIKDKLVMAC